LNKDVYRPKKEAPYVVRVNIPIINYEELLYLRMLK
jgi:hypothetical protein